jgi:hypothetical protein
MADLPCSLSSSGECRSFQHQVDIRLKLPLTESIASFITTHLSPRVSRTHHYLFEKLDVDPTRQRAPPGHQDGLTRLKTCLELFFASRERPSATLTNNAMMVEAYSFMCGHRRLFRVFVATISIAQTGPFWLRSSSGPSKPPETLLALEVPTQTRGVLVR